VENCEAINRWQRLKTAPTFTWNQLDDQEGRQAQRLGKYNFKTQAGLSRSDQQELHGFRVGLTPTTITIERDEHHERAHISYEPRKPQAGIRILG